MSNREVIVSDSNVQAAIAEGLRILGVSRSEVNVTVIEEGKRGLFGIGKKMARIKMELSDRNDDTSQAEKKTDPKAGGSEPARSLKEEESAVFQEAPEGVEIDGNRVRFFPLEEKQFFVIRSDDNVDLYVNGEPVEGSAVVHIEDRVTFRCRDQVPESKINVRVSDDKLKAYVCLEYVEGKIFAPICIPDPQKEGEVLIAGEVKKRISPPEATVNDIRSRLAEEGITFGLDETVFEEVLARSGEEIQVASGRHPEPARDGYIEYLYRDEDTGTQESEKRRIDHFSRNEIISVKKGEVLAVRHPAEEGEPGRNVYGEEIGVSPPRPARWQLGEGVREEENQAVATTSGRPILRGNQLFVREMYLVEGDVDLTVGHIDFHGDVVVTGSVNDNFQVKAGGKIQVLGNVAHAVLEADEGIEVRRNIIGSEINAGGMATFYKQCSYLLEQLLVLKDLKDAVLQLKSHSSFKAEGGDRQIIQLLLDTKFHRVAALVQEFCTLVRENQNREKLLPGLLVLGRYMEKAIRKSGKTTLSTLDELTTLHNKIEEICSILKKFESESADLYARYIQRSRLRATGDIEVETGIYNSTLHAGGEVRLTGKPGIFRGGEIRAQGSVVARELGSPGGSRVRVSVPAKATIRAQRAFVNVFFEVGGEKIELKDKQSDLHVHLDSEGQLSLF